MKTYDLYPTKGIRKVLLPIVKAETYCLKIEVICDASLRVQPSVKPRMHQLFPLFKLVSFHAMPSLVT